MGCCSLLQGIFQTQGSNLRLLHCRQILYSLSYKRSPLSCGPTFTLHLEQCEDTGSRKPWRKSCLGRRLLCGKCPNLGRVLLVSVVSDSLWPHILEPTSLCHPWDSPGKSSRVGCHFLFQRIFPIQGSNPGLLHCRQTLYSLSHQGSPTWEEGRLFRPGCLEPCESWCRLWILSKIEATEEIILEEWCYLPFTSKISLWLQGWEHPRGKRKEI